jgi:hypothetical protein
MLEIETMEAADEFVVELLTADDEPLLDAAGKRCTITVFGPGSKAYAAAQAARTQRLMARMQAKGKTKLTPEEQLADNAQFLAACTKSLGNFTYRSSSTDFEGLYANSRLGYIAEQVGKAIGDWANFTPGSATS